MMKKLTVAILVIIVLLLAAPSWALAAPPEGKGKPDNVGKKPIELAGSDYTTLHKAGKNPDRMVLVKDYSKDNKASRTYKDTETGEVVAIYSMLPMVNRYGEVVEAGWERDGASFISKPNTFNSTVTGTKVEVVSDAGNCFWEPVLYVGGKEVKKLSGPMLLSLDPMDVGFSYWENTLVWDYGVCVRWLRIIEGMVQERWIFDEDPKGEVRIDHRQTGNVPLGVGMAWDADLNLLPATVEYLDDEVVPASAFEGAAYPVTVCATATFVAGKGKLEREGGCGLICNDLWTTLVTGDGDFSYPDTDYLYVHWSGGSVAGNNYFYNDRASVSFDTSDLPNGATVTAAEVQIYGKAKLDPWDNAPSLNIYATTGTSPLSDTPARYNGITGTAWSATSISYANFDQAGWNSFAMNAGGLAGIVDEGFTHVGFRNPNFDVLNFPPTHTTPDNWATGFIFYGVGKGEDYAPRLVITYTPALPTISILDASNVKLTTAILNSAVTNDGGEQCDVRFGYGNTSQSVANFNAYDANTTWVGGYLTDDHPAQKLTGLDINTTYYFRAQIRNSTGTSTSTNEGTFTTDDGIDVPSEIYFLERATEIVFSWTPGAGSTSTLIKYSPYEYPTLTTEGLLVGNFTDNSTTHTGLSQGTRYFYSFWGVSGGNTSATYATVLVATSASFADPESGLDNPTLPAGMMDDPDVTNLPALFEEPLNAMADSLNMDRDTHAMAWGVVIMTVMGIGVLIAVGAAPMLLVVVLAGIALGVVGVVPYWITVLTIIAAIPLGLVLSRQEA